MRKSSGRKFLAALDTVRAMQGESAKAQAYCGGHTLGTVYGARKFNRLHPAHVSQPVVEQVEKADGGKSAHHLLIPEFIDGVAKVMAHGAGTYGPRNWEKGTSWSRYFSAAMRHLWAWWGGEANDQKSGLPHLHHAACCVMFLATYDDRQVGNDDRKS